MKKIKSAHIVAIAFGVVLIIGMLGFFNLNSFLKPVGAALFNWNGEKSAVANIKDIESSVEGLINENVGLRTQFIQANGLAQKLIGKRVVADVDPDSSVIKLDNGYISFLVNQISDDELSTKAGKISSFNTFLNEKGIDFLYVQAPYKIAQNDQQLPFGLQDHAVSNAQTLCSMLDKDVRVLNLINTINEQGLDWYSLYYKTDHHWTNETAFWALGEIARELDNEFGINIDPIYHTADNYSVRSYPQSFLGTQGKRVGSTYAGLDDINFYIPNFETSLEYQRQSVLLKGSFDDTLLFDETYLTGDKFGDFCYEASMGGNYGYIKVTNHLEPDGKKVLLIKDSYANPVAPYLALGVSELEVIDPRYFEEEMKMSISEYVSQSNPDVVIMLYNPNAFKTDAFFNF